MNIGQWVRDFKVGWRLVGMKGKLKNPQLVLVFGGRRQLNNKSTFESIFSMFSTSTIVMCSTAGEISRSEVWTNSVQLTAIELSHSTIEVSSVNIKNEKGSREAGVKLAKSLPRKGLRSVFVLSDGQLVNGSELVQGLNNIIPEHVPITGGLAGDGTNFQKTLVGLNGVTQTGTIVGIGFYGDRLNIGHGSQGGWEPFGPERLVTKAISNVLYELDDQNALGLYEKYLGDLATDLPEAALLYPLSIRTNKDDTPVVRTILGIDNEAKTMTFAGDMPVGARARLMKSNYDRLIEGAMEAANYSYKCCDQIEPELAILISCVGRKLVLGPKVEDEIQAVKDVLGENTAVTGFYSYGEICPFEKSTFSKLHNQTMTITTLSES